MSDSRFAILTTLIIILSYMVAMTVSSLERVLAYVGSTGSTSISFILPGLFYYKISDPNSIVHQKIGKEDDDDDDSDEYDSTSDIAGGGGGGGGGGGAEDGLLTTTTTTSNSGRLFYSHRWRKHLLRQLSLALAIYGVVVMVVCLITHTFFVVLH